MNVEEMVIKHSLKPRGVIQVGSHHGEEIELWRRLRVMQVHFEPLKSNVDVIMQKYSDIKGFTFALGNENGWKRMFTETVNGGQSCSLLQPKEHLRILPWIDFNGEEMVQVRRLDDIIEDGAISALDYNFMYVDVQGYELEVFKGAEHTLASIDFIFTEVNRGEVFEGCALVEELDAFLGKHGFKRVETEWHGGEFGDALYVRGT